MAFRFSLQAVLERPSLHSRQNRFRPNTANPVAMIRMVIFTRWFTVSLLKKRCTTGRRMRFREQSCRVFSLNGEWPIEPESFGVYQYAMTGLSCVSPCSVECWRKYCRLSLRQRKVNDLILPFFLIAALNGKSQLVDETSYPRTVIHDENASYFQSRTKSMHCVKWHRCSVVCKQDSIVLVGPIEKRRITDPGKPDILNPNQVEFRQTTSQATDDVTVKVFVTD